MLLRFIINVKVLSENWMNKGGVETPNYYYISTSTLTNPYLLRSPPYWTNHVADTSPVGHKQSQEVLKGEKTHHRHLIFSLEAWRLLPRQHTPWHVIWMIAWGVIENDSTAHAAGEFPSFVSHTGISVSGFDAEWKGSGHTKSLSSPHWAAGSTQVSDGWRLIYRLSMDGRSQARTR